MGITIGVFCISLILTVTDSLNANIQKSLSKIGDEVIYVQKWPWSFSSDYPWWKFVKRPDVSYREMQLLEKRFPQAQYIAFKANAGNRDLSYGSFQAENIPVHGVSTEYAKINNFQFQQGRYFSNFESDKGRPVIVLGHAIAENLFPFGNASGKRIKLLNKRFTIIGVLEKEGEGINTNMSNDKKVFIPVNYLRKYFNLSENFSTEIAVMGKKGVPLENIEGELRGVMRTIRKLHPREEDNFALNKITLITNLFDQIFRVANMAGWFIAAFSILVGGFGVANIMFVSVKERTPIIGIQKALGAFNIFVLIQFLGEAIFLCLIGGVVGISLVALSAVLINSVVDFEIVLTLSNIFTGLGLSTFIGLISGFVPALQASRMSPIEAIRSNA